MYAITCTSTKDYSSSHEKTCRQSITLEESYALADFIFIIERFVLYRQIRFRSLRQTIF